MKFTFAILAVASVDAISQKSLKKSDPICSSAGCSQYLHPQQGPGHPIDYPVADFGVDHHIKETQAYEKQAEEQVGVDWVPKKDADGKWDVPKVDIDFKLAQKKDSPSCSSDDGSDSASGYCPETFKARAAKKFRISEDIKS